MKHRLIPFVFAIFFLIGCTNREGEIIDLINSIKKQNDDLKAQITALKKTTDSALVAVLKVNSLQTATDKKIDLIQTDLKSLLTQIASLTTQMTAANADLVSLKSKIDALQVKCAELVAQIALLNANSSTLKNGLVAYYPFNGNANDVSGNNYTGVVYGATLTTDKNGNSNSAYLFNKSSIDIGTLPKLGNSPTAFTQSAWLLAPQDQSSYCKLPIMSKRQEQSGQCSWATLAAGGNGTIGAPWNGQAVFWVNADFYYLGLNNALVSTSKTTDGKWHLITGVKEGTSYKLYFDGILQSSKIDNLVFYSDKNMTIGYEGAWGFECERYFNGKIDDVGIWNRALTASEVNYLYSNGFNP